MLSACHAPFLDAPQRSDDMPLASTLWTVQIQPSFHAWSQLGFVRTTRGGVVAGYRLGMVVGGFPEATARLDLPTLDEPRFEIEPVLWPREDGAAMIDGCRYRVTFFHSDANTTIDFVPTSATLRTWARQFFSTARLLQTKVGNEDLGEYLQAWEQYLQP